MTEAEIRDHFPGVRRLRYFNAASASLLPTPVADAVRAVLDRQVEGGIHSWPEDIRGVESARSLVAALIGSSPRDVAFTANTAEAVARVAGGLDWRAGDEVVLCDLEFPANLYPWAAQAPRGVRLRIVPSSDGRIEASRLAEAIGPRTRVLAVSMVQFSSGHRCDLHLLGRACRDRGVLFFVDAIQGLGVYPVDVESMAIGALASEGRKWLMAPAGTGFLYVAPEWVERIAPSTPGSMSVRPSLGMLGWVSRVANDGALDLAALYRDGAGRYESGIYNMAGLAGLAAALRFREAIGPDVIRARVEERVAELVEGFGERGLPVYGPRIPEERSGIVAFDVPGDPEGWRIALAEAGVSVGVREGRLRAAPHVYNDRKDVEALLEALDRIRRARVS